MIQPTHSILVNGFPHVPYHPMNLSPGESLQCSAEFYQQMDTRRSIREFSTQPIDEQVIKNLIMTAGTAPSGAHKQPWHFCCISDPDIKKQIRIAAEEEEREGYSNRMSERWLKDLAPIGTDWHKPFIEDAPWLVAAFKKIYEIDDEGSKANNYYVSESIGIACGLLITAIHQAGLVTLTHTPSPMNFLSKILGRPDNERPFLLLPIGYPKSGTHVPDFHRKPLSEISTFY